jgi:hypothetical protein
MRLYQNVLQFLIIIKKDKRLSWDPHMTKRKMLPVNFRGRGYRLALDDIKKVHHQIKKPRPILPRYSSDEEKSFADKQVAEECL